MPGTLSEAGWKAGASLCGSSVSWNQRSSSLPGPGGAHAQATSGPPTWRRQVRPRDGPDLEHQRVQGCSRMASSSFYFTHDDEDTPGPTGLKGGLILAASPWKSEVQSPPHVNTLPPRDGRVRPAVTTRGDTSPASPVSLLILLLKMHPTHLTRQSANLSLILYLPNAHFLKKALFGPPRNTTSNKTHLPETEKARFKRNTREVFPQ